MTSTRDNTVTDICKTIGIYVDGQNLFRSAWALGPKYGLDRAKPDYEAVMCEAIEAACDVLAAKEVDLMTATVYSVGRHSSKKFTKALDATGFAVRMHVLRQRGSCQLCNAQNDRFSWRTEIVVDVISDAIFKGLDAVVLVVGSPEFVCLARKLEEHGVTVLALGYAGKTSEKLPNVRYLTERSLYGDPIAKKRG